jgi:hypothetical protein
VHEREPDYYVGDPSIRNSDPITGTSVLIEYVNHGIPIVLGNNAAGSVSAGIDLVKKHVIGIGDPPNNVPTLYVTKNCINTIREMQRYRWAKWVSRKANEEKNKQEQPVKKDDHTCDMLRYAISSRPVHEDGTSIPEKKVPFGAAEPVNPYNERVAVDSDTDDECDPHLGREY